MDKQNSLQYLVNATYAVQLQKEEAMRSAADANLVDGVRYLCKQCHEHPIFIDDFFHVAQPYFQKWADAEQHNEFKNVDDLNNSYSAFEDELDYLVDGIDPVAEQMTHEMFGDDISKYDV